MRCRHITVTITTGLLTLAGLQPALASDKGEEAAAALQEHLTINGTIAEFSPRAAWRQWSG